MLKKYLVNDMLLTIQKTRFMLSSLGQDLCIRTPFSTGELKLCLFSSLNLLSIGTKYGNSYLLSLLFVISCAFPVHNSSSAL